MGGGNCLWLVSFFNGNGIREYRTTPYLPTQGAAFAWLIQQRPYLLTRPDEIEVRPWRRGDPR